MERIQRILAHSFYRECLSKIAEWEKTRPFCGHDMTHFLDVARIAMIFNLKEHCNLSQEMIYAAALLHDVGRFVQYEDGTDHAQASARLAPSILEECGYTKEESTQIVEAIANHRNSEIAEDSDLKGLIYRADKASRPCYGCLMEPECDWPKKKKNGELLV